jgi:ubiquinone/menaquinone biosynthesis C-methylase UbiE
VENLKSKTLLEIGGVYYAGIAAETIPGIEAIALDPIMDFHLNIHQNNSGKCRYINGTAEQMQFNDSSIDICICANAIDHMQSPDEALREIRRVLKTDGSLYISCNVYNEWSRPLFPLFNLLDLG